MKRDKLDLTYRKDRLMKLGFALECIALMLGSQAAHA